MISRVNSETNVFSNIFALCKLASPLRRIQFFLLLILIVLASFAELFSIGAVIPFLGVISDPEKVFQLPFLQPFIDVMEITNPSQLLFPLTLIFCIGVLLTSSLRLLLLWVSIRLSFAFGADISIDIYKHTLYQPYSVHCDRNSSEILSGISAKSNVVIYQVVVPALTLIGAVVMVTAIFGFLISLDPEIALITFSGFGLIYGVIVYLTRKKLSRDSQRIAEESTAVIKALQEGLGGIRDILLDGSQSVYCDTYRASDLPLRRAQGNNIFVAQSPRFLMEGLGMLLIAIIAYTSAQSSESFSDAIPLLGGLALGAQRALPVLQSIFNCWASINGANFTLRDTLELLNQPIPASALEDKPEPMTFKEDIQIKDLCFTYNPETPNVFQGFNLVIPKGSRVGFKGTTGSGKSTLLDIIMGLLQPNTGIMLIDGTPITSHNLRAWQLCIAHVPQFIFLSDSTIEENIAFGIPKHLIDKDRVRMSAKQAQISDFIEGLPNQYKTSAGEQGVLLSGGQRQRIGIARAIYKQASVIIFDEATSALDTETESKVMEAINSLSKDITVIIVAHRLSTLEGCSHIIDLDKLRIEDR